MCYLLLKLMVMSMPAAYGKQHILSQVHPEQPDTEGTNLGCSGHFEHMHTVSVLW